MNGNERLFGWTFGGVFRFAMIAGMWVYFRFTKWKRDRRAARATNAVTM